MATKRRENARIEKQRKKEKRIRIVIWVLIAVAFFTLAGMRIAEINFNSLIHKLENGEVVQNASDAYPVSLDTSSGVKLYLVNDRIAALTDLSCRILNPANAKQLYAFSSGYANPVMKTAGKYLFTFDQGGTRLRLDNTTENIYEGTLKQQILCGDVASGGSFVYVTRYTGSKSVVTVMSSQLSEKAKFTVKYGYPVAAAMDEGGSHFALAVLSTKDAKICTTVYTYRVGSNQPVGKFEYKNSDVLSINYTGSDLYYVAKDSVHIIRSQKKDITVFEQGKINTVLYNYTPDGRLVYVYSEYADASENYVAYIKPNGKIKTTVTLKQKPKYVSASNDICVLFSDKVVTYSVSKGEEKESYPCDDSVSSADKISTKIIITRHQLVDVLNK